MSKQTKQTQEITDVQDKTLELLQSMIQTGESTLDIGINSGQKMQEQREKMNQTKTHSDNLGSKLKQNNK